MTEQEKLQLARALTESRMTVFEKKGRMYSGLSRDALSNFKRNAEDLGLSKYQVWAVYAFKHIDAIKLAIKQCPDAPKEPTEHMAGRITDAINYLEILFCLLWEDGLINETDRYLPQLPGEFKTAEAQDNEVPVLQVSELPDNIQAETRQFTKFKG